MDTYDLAPDQPRRGVVAKPAASPKHNRHWLARILVLLVAAAAIYGGIGLRRWAWDQTTDIRFTNSVNNAIRWGRSANEVGVYNVYDTLVKQYGSDAEFEDLNMPGVFALDYPPLRLMIVSWWADWAQQHMAGGGRVNWQPEYEFTAPMLYLNMACELAASLGMFLLVYHWLRVCRGSAPEPWWRWGDHPLPAVSLADTNGMFPAILAALLLWFNPAVMFNAHVYPQWDVWVLPAIIFGFYFVLRGWWLAAGFIVGLEAMGKGQILVATPLLLALPLLRGQLPGVLRILIGMAGAIALVVWPWMLRSPESLQWMTHLGVAGAILVLVNLLPRKGKVWPILRGLPAMLACGVVYWFVRALPREQQLYALALIGAVMALAMLGSRWWAPSCALGLWAGGLALTVPMYGASMAWYDIGIKYGTRHWRHLYWCHASNLGSIMEVRYNWQFADTINLSWIPWIGPSTPVPIRLVMVWAFAALLSIGIIAAVRHRVKHDPRLLLSLALPFMLAFAVLPQMIDRYLMWPAALISAYAAISIGGVVLWLVLSLLACVMMADYIMGFVLQAPEAQYWLPYLQVTFPDIGWGVLVLAGVMLYAACLSTPRKEGALPLQQR